jgi:hypothetical protein
MCFIAFSPLCLLFLFHQNGKRNVKQGKILESYYILTGILDHILAESVDRSVAEVANLDVLASLSAEREGDRSLVGGGQNGSCVPINERVAAVIKLEAVDLCRLVFLKRVNASRLIIRAVIGDIRGLDIALEEGCEGLERII